MDYRDASVYGRLKLRTIINDKYFIGLLISVLICQQQQQQTTKDLFAL